MNAQLSAEVIPKEIPVGTIKAPDWLLNATLANLSASIAQKLG